MLTKNEFIERNLKIKFKIYSASEIRNRFLKMLEAKVSIMRNSINFNFFNKGDSFSFANGFGFGQRKSKGNNGEFEMEHEEEEIADELFKKVLSPSRMND